MVVAGIALLAEMGQSGINQGVYSERICFCIAIPEYQSRLAPRLPLHHGELGCFLRTDAAR